MPSLPEGNGNNVACASFWEEKSIVFYSNNIRNSTDAQSLSSLMAAFVKLGRTVYLITNEPPHGDDFVTDTGIKRFVLSYLELEGYSTSAAFYKVLGKLPAKAVVFASPFNDKTYQSFIAAEKLGRCIILLQHQSPLNSLAAGNAKTVSEYLYMIKNAGRIISISDQDAKLMQALGVRNAVSVPFYFPYFDKEVSASKLEGRKIIYYTTYLGKNSRSVITAFARLRQRFPDTSMHIIILSGIKKGKTLENLLSDVTNSELSDCLTIERGVLKPLRYLRDASVSVTYAHPMHMPKTVMESICAGIPALLLRDADYSEDGSPAVCLNIADTFAIEEKLAEFMDIGIRAEYSEKVRKLLHPDYRLELAKNYLNIIDEALNEYNEALRLCAERGSAVRNKIASAVQLGMTLNDIFKAMILSKVPCGEIIAASVLCGIKIEDMLSAYESAGFLGKSDYNKAASRISYWSGYQGSFTGGADKAKLEKQYRNKNSILPDMVAALAVGGVPLDEISSCMPDIFIDSLQAEMVLQNAVNTNQCNRSLTEIDYINASLLALEDFQGLTPAALNTLNALKAFFYENYRFLNYKRHKLVRMAIDFQTKYNKPLREMKMPLKLIVWPFKLRTQLKILIHLKGKKRLLQREVSEVDPADTRKIQLMVFQILLEFEKICKRNNLRFYLAGGSILGAVRHKGFIPWDDDIDITMPRPDYEKFLKIAQTELPEEYILEKDCLPYCHNRVEIRGTKFYSGLRNGRIFLDILALEGSPDDPAKRLQHEAKCKFWRTCMLEKARPLPALAFNKTSTKLFFNRFVLRLTPRRFLKWRWHSWATKYSTEETNSWVCLPASIYTYEQERFPKEYWGDPVYIEFEGHMLPTMSHWKDYLVCHFGDYMKMPPETTRKSHHYIYEYDLGKYAAIPTEELEKKLLGKQPEI